MRTIQVLALVGLMSLIACAATEHGDEFAEHVASISMSDDPIARLIVVLQEAEEDASGKKLQALARYCHDGGYTVGVCAEVYAAAASPLTGRAAAPGVVGFRARTLAASCMTPAAMREGEYDYHYPCDGVTERLARLLDESAADPSGLELAAFQGLCAGPFVGNFEGTCQDAGRMAANHRSAHVAGDFAARVRSAVAQRDALAGLRPLLDEAEADASGVKLDLLVDGCHERYGYSRDLRVVQGTACADLEMAARRRWTPHARADVSEQVAEVTHALREAIAAAPAGHSAGDGVAAFEGAVYAAYHALRARVDVAQPFPELARAIDEAAALGVEAARLTLARAGAIACERRSEVMWPKYRDMLCADAPPSLARDCEAAQHATDPAVCGRYYLARRPLTVAALQAARAAGLGDAARDAARVAIAGPAVSVDEKVRLAVAGLDAAEAHAVRARFVDERLGHHDFREAARLAALDAGDEALLDRVGAATHATWDPALALALADEHHRPALAWVARMLLNQTLIVNVRTPLPPEVAAWKYARKARFRFSRIGCITTSDGCGIIAEGPKCAVEKDTYVVCGPSRQVEDKKEVTFHENGVWSKQTVVTGTHVEGSGCQTLVGDFPRARGDVVTFDFLGPRSVTVGKGNDYHPWMDGGDGRPTVTKALETLVAETREQAIAAARAATDPAERAEQLARAWLLSLENAADKSWIETVRAYLRLPADVAMRLPEPDHSGSGCGWVGAVDSY